jgi:hypothetical protein
MASYTGAEATPDDSLLLQSIAHDFEADPPSLGGDP